MRVAERWLGKAIDGLRAVGARGLTNAGLRLVRMLKRDQPAAAVLTPAPGAGEPAGPFLPHPAADAPALLFFVPRSLRSRLIDGATGGYGYSHVVVDCGEIDQPTGKRVIIESAPGLTVHRSFLDEYGARPFARALLAGLMLPERDALAAGSRPQSAGNGTPAAGASEPLGIDVEAFCRAVQSKLGQPYDNVEALTWGEVDDPAKQICSDLVAVCLPRSILEDMARQHAAGRLPRRSLSVRNRATPEFRAFVSPNALAAYFGAPPGERLRMPDELVRPPGGGLAVGGGAGRAAGARRLRSLPYPARVGGAHEGRALRAKLIYNPAAGPAGQAGAQLTEILAELQRCDILPEVHLVTPESHLEEVAANALRRGIRLVIVAGGDGTIDKAMGGLLGTHGTLGIIPTGTRNNVALSLGIRQGNIPAAVALLRTGRRRRIDVGRAHCNGTAHWFLEAGAVGLVSALYPAADDLQHGDLARVGDLVTTFLSATPGEIRLCLNGKEEIVVDEGHMVVLANMPYVGAHFHPSSRIACDDGLLDVLVYGHLSKLDLLTYAVQLSSGAADDPRVAHYQARRVDVRGGPGMPAMVDGVLLGEGALRVSLHPHALAVMIGEG
jgi:diacylglycerol kinase (ATP)